MLLDRSFSRVFTFEAAHEYFLSADMTLRTQAAAVWNFLDAAASAPARLVLESEPGEGASEASPALRKRAVSTLASSQLVLYTSGTTGKPKRVQIPIHKRAGDRRHAHPGRWLLTYSPFRWAGISVVLHAYRTDGELVVPVSLDPGAIVLAGREYRVTHISLTPSLFRKMLLSQGKDVLSALPITQVTFGGEATTQSTLNAASAVWPGAQVSHVYAITEFGDVLSVSDGIAGVPRHKFERDPFSFTAGGELLIGGVQTGDFWQLSGERYRFMGRAEEMINVGGAKVSPLVVEEIASAIGGVRQVRAFGARNPLLGQVVALQYVGEISESELKAKMSGALPKVAVPVIIDRVAEIELTPAGKMARPAR